MQSINTITIVQVVAGVRINYKCIIWNADVRRMSEHGTVPLCVPEACDVSFNKSFISLGSAMHNSCHPLTVAANYQGIH